MPGKKIASSRSMERLVLSVWLTIVAGTWAGGAQRATGSRRTERGFTETLSPVPAGNMLTEARVKTPGRRLFYDKQVSRAGEVACTTCQRPTTSAFIP